MSKYGLREDEMEESLEAMSKDYAESNQVLEQFMNADLLFQQISYSLEEIRQRDEILNLEVDDLEKLERVIPTLFDAYDEQEQFI